MTTWQIVQEWVVNRWFPTLCISAGLSWRIVDLMAFALPHDRRAWSILMTLTWGLIPYLCIATLARRIRRALLRVGALAIVFAWDGSTLISVMRQGNSTASVALLLQPIWATVLLLLAVALLGGFRIGED